MERIVDIYDSLDNETWKNSEKTRHTAPTHGPRDQCPESGRKYIVVAVCLGLLCVLLLAGVIGLSVHYNVVSKSFFAKMTKSSKERSQLQTRYKNLSEERDRLQSERDYVLQTFSNLKLLQKFGSSLYIISTDKKTWNKSREDCLDKGADLVIINTKEEQMFIAGLKRRFWIGLTDSETENVWKWVDGTPLTTQHWGDEQPDNFLTTKGDEDCVEMTLSWNDLNCVNERKWICEKVV